MKITIPELLDRLSIVRLKIERIGEAALAKEFEALQAAVDAYKQEGHTIDASWLETLYVLNGQIWDLEFDIRRGKEGELGLEEVGRRAIAIRELNKKRVTLKNTITEATGSGYKDVKMNHASA